MTTGKKRGRPRQELSAKQVTELLKLEETIRAQQAALQLSRERWASYVEDVGQAGAGRALGMSPQTVHERLRSVREAKAKRRRSA